jgi:hypothetical protein
MANLRPPRREGLEYHDCGRDCLDRRIAHVDAHSDQAELGAGVLLSSFEDIGTNDPLPPIWPFWALALVAAVALVVAGLLL